MITPALLAAVHRAARELPPSVLESVARKLETVGRGPHPPMMKTWLLRDLAVLEFRQALSEMVDAWCRDAPETDGPAVAFALAASAHAESAARSELAVELVWTGPDPDGPPLRRTEQVLTQMIDDARERLLIVSFAVYRVAEIAAALGRALDRGVKVRFVVETPEASDGKITFDGTTTLGRSILDRAEVLVWPLEKRPVDAEGRHGSLHVKCAVADGTRLFVSSANLTEFALSLNMEIGAMIESAALAERVENHFTKLIQTGILAKPRS